MSTITFFQQSREDGGLRTGIEIDGLSHLELLEIDGEEYDPALSWYVELQFDGDALPSSAEAARHWLLDNSDFIQVGMKAMAEKLSVGLDARSDPLQWSIPDAPEGVHCKIICMAVRRLEGREISKHITRISNQWDTLVKSLPEVHAYS